MIESRQFMRRFVIIEFGLDSTILEFHKIGVGLELQNGNDYGDPQKLMKWDEARTLIVTHHYRYLKALTP